MTVGKDRPSLALEPVADRLRLCESRLKIRRQLHVAIRALPLIGRLDLPHGGLRGGAIVGAIGDQNRGDPLVAEALRPVERIPLTRVLFEPRKDQRPGMSAPQALRGKPAILVA
jgi:hypothetical protein